MAIKPIFYFALSVALITSMVSCQGDCGTSLEKASLYGGKTVFSPELDSLPVGDTLWLSSSIPFKLNNAAYVDSVQYDMSNASGMVTEIGFLSLISIGIYAGAVDSFALVAKQGSIKDHPIVPQASKLITYAVGNEAYLFTMGMIAKKRGVYCIQLLDIFKAQKKCFKASILVADSNTDQHLHYLQDLYYGSDPMAPGDANHAYCFKVY